MKNFENFSQPAQLVGEPDQRVHYFMFSRTKVRALGIVWVSSHSVEVRIVHRLFFWIPYSVRNVLKDFENFRNQINQLGNRISRFIRLCFQEQQLGH